MRLPLGRAEFVQGAAEWRVGRTGVSGHMKMERWIVQKPKVLVELKKCHCAFCGTQQRAERLFHLLLHMHFHSSFRIISARWPDTETPIVHCCSDQCGAPTTCNSTQTMSMDIKRAYCHRDLETRPNRSHELFNRKMRWDKSNSIFTVSRQIVQECVG